MMEVLGVFDSGIGGFNIVNELRKAMNLNIVFLADHQNLPYGNKGDEKLKAILLNNIQWFVDKNIKDILLACNTASVYIDYLRKQFPQVNIYSIVEITALKFNNNNLMIFGTNKTVNSKIYDRHLTNKASYLALSDLAFLIEENNQEVIEKYLQEKLADIRHDQDFLLGCTHYSIYKDLFEKFLNKKVYDSVIPVVNFFKKFNSVNKLTVYSSGNVKILEDQLLKIFDYDLNVIPKNEEFKIVVVSDNHGLYSPLSKVLAAHKDASAFIHCGDVELDPNLVNSFYAVSGNNDYFYDFPKELLINIGHLKVYVTHGHEHMRYKRIENIYKVGKKYEADLICYGHEHIYQTTWFEKILLLNPGSLYYNRDQSPTSYAIVTVVKDGYKVERVNFFGEEIWVILK